MKRSLSGSIFAAAGFLAAGVFALLAPSPAQRAGGDDYLSAALRRDVEAFKTALRGERTTADNLDGRADTLWRWINAYSLTGGPVPVNATRSIGNAVRALNEWKRGGPAPPAAVLRDIDRFGYEFALKDEEPRALGKVTLKIDEPVAAGSWRTIEQTYAVGARPVEQGGTIMVARQLQSDAGRLQGSDPGADHYVSAKTSNPHVRLTETVTSWSGMHGGFRSPADLPSFKVAEGRLDPGDTVTVVYGDRSGGSKGWRQQSFESDQVLLPLYIDLDGSGIFLTPAWPGFRVAGGAASGVSVVAPSVVEPGEKFDVSIRWEDKIYNRATGGAPAAAVTVNGKQVSALAAGEPALNVLEGLALDREGVFRYEVRSADGKIGGRSNPVWVRKNPPYRVFWGETHTHTAMAEGQGSLDGSYRYGRDDARLDFMGISEHDSWLDDAEWRAMQRAVERYTQPGRFIAFLGYEWSVPRAQGGHHNVFFRSSKSARVGKQIAPDLSSLYQGLRARYASRDVIAIPHAHQAGDWRRNDPDIENLVEIMSMHGTFEWFGNYYLRNGRQIGFIAASDDHRSKPGYSSVSASSASTPLQQFGGLAAVMAPEKTTDAIFDALKERRSYAVTSAQRILIDMEMNGAGMGKRIPFTAQRRIRARVMGTAPITEAAVVKNGEVVYVKRPSQTTLQSKSRVVIGFESSSEPFFRDNPRPYRLWKGELRVANAKLTSLRALNFDNLHREFASAAGNVVKFLTRTRGRADTLMLELAGASPATEIAIRLDEAEECCKAPIPIRPLMTIPGQTLTVKLGELAAGHVVKPTPFGSDPDKIVLQLIGEEQPLDYDFEFVDTGKAAHGDYYYVRVEQLDGARAWSSPTWVGGEQPR